MVEEAGARPIAALGFAGGECGKAWVHGVAPASA